MSKVEFTNKLEQEVREEWEKQRVQKRKVGTRKVLLITLVLVLIGAVFFRREITSAAASAFSGSKTENGSGDEKTQDNVIVNQKWEMPDELTEISALSYIDDDRFACVQDELGTIFIYNIATSSIESRVPFAKSGDYEGLAMVGNIAWVLRADGKLFEINDISAQKPDVKEYSTHLTAEQNVEGLCYDKEHNRLLLAIKDKEPDSKDYKGVYAFNLADKKMPEEPVFRIDLANPLLRASNDSKDSEKKSGIKPSAIAVHPSTGDIYITDGPDAKLLVMDAKGTIKALYQLDHNKFIQPEGITFKSDGHLFISNEGKKQKGNILSVEIENKGKQTVATE